MEEALAVACGTFAAHTGALVTDLAHGVHLFGFQLLDAFNHVDLVGVVGGELQVPSYANLRGGERVGLGGLSWLRMVVY